MSDLSRRGELSVVRLEGTQASLEVALQGAHVIEWARPGARSALFVSPNSAFCAGKAIRGGVPLIFPWFGPKRDDAAAPQHGFARAREWSVEEASVEPDGSCTVAMVLKDDERTRAAWPHAFEARFTVQAGQQLRMALAIRNGGTRPFTFEAALHTYLAVSDVRGVRLRGLENTSYLDKVAGGARRLEGGEPIALAGETDRVYLDTTAPCTLEDPAWQRRIVIAKSGSRSTVVWNPWLEKARAMADLGDPAWQGMLCVETANAAGDARTLARGDSHVLEATIETRAL